MKQMITGGFEERSKGSERVIGDAYPKVDLDLIPSGGDFRGSDFAGSSEANEGLPAVVAGGNALDETLEFKALDEVCGGWLANVKLRAEIVDALG